MMKNPADGEYDAKIAREAQHWGDHLKVEGSGQWNAWLDHPLIAEHYRHRGLIDSLPWEKWVAREVGGAVGRSLDLGCGAGNRSLALYADGLSRSIDGLDVSGDRLEKAEERRRATGAPGGFRSGDVNQLVLPANSYDLIFSCHSFHHFLEIEHIMRQVHQSLTPRGLFVLEEFVGPTQFQWTDQQIEIVRSLISLVPEKLRNFRWDAIKYLEGRPTPAEVVAVSPFESIRSAEIFPLFKQYFEVVAVKRLGGTIQHLFYNGIVHNFSPGDHEALRCLQAIWKVEDILVDSELLPSDFMLLIGRRKDSPLAREERMIAEQEGGEVARDDPAGSSARKGDRISPSGIDISYICPNIYEHH